MRKILLFLLCLMLLAIPALATSSAQMYISAGSATCYRGDTVSFAVQLSQVEDCRSGGLIVSYDSEVFSWVSGECTVSGASIKDFSQGTGVFTFDSATAVSGGVFRFTLKVRENAPFGSSTIGGSANVRVSAGSIPCSAQGATVRILCKHSYENCTKTDADTHTITCAHCGDTKSESHNFTAKTDKPATCKEPGTETLTCSGCGFAKTQSIPQSNTHMYSGWSKVNDSAHKHSCSICGKEESASHSWDSGKITKAATCIAAGTRVRSCTGCKATKTETVSKSAEHPYSAWERTDDQTHSRVCPVCNQKDTAPHRFDNWDHDEVNHYQLCADCGIRNGQDVHTPGPAATETTEQICTVCQRVLAPSTAHNHVFSEQWQQDNAYHWHKCEQCEEKQGLSVHTFTDECDSDCNVCGAVRLAPHIPTAAFNTDDAGHWYDCTACDAQLQWQAHIPGAAATLKNAQLCDICQHVLTPKLTHSDHNFSTTHIHECECGEVLQAGVECALCADARRDFPWWLIVIIEGVVLGGVIVYLLLKKPYISKFSR